MKLTKKREKILDVLHKAKSALSAAEVHARVSDIDLVTIYRNLELFVEEQRIKRVILGTNEARYEYQEEPHHHAVCTDCKKIVHFKAPDEKIKKLLGLNNFNIEELEVMVKGKCCN